jgi:vitamin B12 transporter
VTKKWTVNANATYTKVEEDLNIRIPELKVNARLDYQICDATFLSLSYQFNDDRRDAVFNNDTFMNDDVTLKSYSLFDFYLSHKLLNNKLTVFANVTNLLNEEYMELFGFETRGRNINLGITLRL